MSSAHDVSFAFRSRRPCDRLYSGAAARSPSAAIVSARRRPSLSGSMALPAGRGGYDSIAGGGRPPRRARRGRVGESGRHGVDFDAVVERRGDGELQVGPLRARRAALLGGRHGPALAAGRGRGAQGPGRPRRLRLLAHVTDALVAALLAHLRDGYGWTVAPEALVFLPGVVPALNLACRAYASARRGGAHRRARLPAVPRGARPAGPRARDASAARRAGGRWELPLAALEAAVTPATQGAALLPPAQPARPRLERRRGRRRGRPLPPSRPGARLRRDPLRPRSSSPAPTCPPPPPRPTRRRAHRHAHGAEQDLQPARPQLRLRRDPRRGAAPPLRRGRRRCAAVPGCFAIAAAEAAYREGGAWLAELRAYLRGNADLVASFVAGRAARA